MRAVAIILTIIGVLGFILSIVAKLGAGMVSHLGTRTLGNGSALCFLLAIVLLLMKEKK